MEKKISDGGSGFGKIFWGWIESEKDFLTRPAPRNFFSEGHSLPPWKFPAMGQVWRGPRGVRLSAMLGDSSCQLDEAWPLRLAIAPARPDANSCRGRVAARSPSPPAPAAAATPEVATRTRDSLARHRS